MIFKEISGTMGVDVQISPHPLLNIINNKQMKRQEKELAIIMVTVARSTFANNWKNNNQISIKKWYRKFKICQLMKN